MKILLFDYSPLFVKSLEIMLKANGIDVVGSVRDVREAIKLYDMLQPDLILMDFQMPGYKGIEAVKLIKEEYPSAKILILTACEDEKNFLAAIRAGVIGYLLKNVEPDEFFHRLKEIALGKIAMDAGLSDKLLLHLVNTAAKPIKTNETKLTNRQYTVIKFLVQGFSYKQIAVQLTLKDVTVKYHVKSILSKLHLANKAQLIAYAYKEGII